MWEKKYKNETHKEQTFKSLEPSTAIAPHGTCSFGMLKMDFVSETPTVEIILYLLFLIIIFDSMQFIAMHAHNFILIIIAVDRFPLIVTIEVNKIYNHKNSRSAVFFSSRIFSNRIESQNNRKYIFYLWNREKVRKK